MEQNILEQNHFIDYLCEMIRAQKRMRFYIPIRLSLDKSEINCCREELTEYTEGHFQLVQAIAEDNTDEIIDYMNAVIGFDQNFNSVIFDYDYDGTSMIRVVDTDAINAAKKLDIIMNKTPIPDYEII